MGHHWVETATLVEPRTAPALSVNCTKIRLLAGKKGTRPFAAAKTPKVGVPLALIVVITLFAGGDMQTLLAGLVWQILICNGRAAAPVLADAVITLVAPILIVATAIALDPVLPGTCMMPSFIGVAASAITSGPGVAEAE